MTLDQGPDERPRLRRLIRALLGERLTAAINESRNFHRTVRSPDRTIMKEKILPAFAGLGGHLLWIGCRRYTADYPLLLEQQGAVCWTIDIDPEAAKWGRKGRHVIGDIGEAPERLEGVVFDGILCNGILGFGVDTTEAQHRCLSAISRMLKPGGTLLLSWNTDRTDDPFKAGVVDDASLAAVPFAGLAARVAVPGTTHVYDFLRKLPP